MPKTRRSISGDPRRQRNAWPADRAASEPAISGWPSPTITVDGKQITVAEAVQWAEEHLFERNSVVLECQVWQEALGRARGENFSVSELTDVTRQRGYIRDEARPGEVTLRDVLLREWRQGHFNGSNEP